jgi:Ca2+/H+ antiporter
MVPHSYSVPFNPAHLSGGIKYQKYKINNMGAAQIIIVVLVSMDIAINIAKDGEVKKPNNYSFKESLIVNAILIAILWWGGFFN